MDKKKKILIIGGIVLVIIVIAIVAIYFLTKKNSNGKTNDKNQKVTITYWGLWESKEVMEPLIKEYENNHPNVDIVYVQKSFTQYEKSLLSQLNEPASPDIVRIHNTWTPMLQKYLAPLPSTVMDTNTYKTTFQSIAQTSFTGTDGNLYAIPLEIDGLVLYYNKDLFNKAQITAPPTDWDQFTEYAKKLTVSENGKITQAGAAIGCVNNIRHADEIIALMMLQNNVQFVSNNKFSLSDTRFSDAINYYTNFVLTHKVWSDGFDDDLQMFFEGKLAMMFAPSWRVFDILNSNPSLNFDIASVPQIPSTSGQGAPVNLATYWGEAVSKKSQNQAIAWDFINFLASASSMKKFYSNSISIGLRAFGEPYSRQDLSSSLSSSPYVKTIMEIAPSMKQLPLLDKSSQILYIYPIVKEKIDKGSVSNQILTDTETKINEKIKSYSQ